MTQPDSVSFSSTPTVEQVMAALAKGSIFDLPDLAQKVVDAVRTAAENEDDPPVLDIIVSEGFVYFHGHQAKR